MYLKNTLKLAFVNSSNIWKILLYRILCLLCVLGLTTVVAWPIISVLIKDNFFVNLQKSFENMLFNLNFESLFVTVDNVFKNFAQIISNHGYVAYALLCFIFDVILISFLEQYSSLAVHQSVGGYMSSLTKYGFTNSYVSNFGKATLLALARLVSTLVLNILIWVGLYFMASILYQKVGVLAIILTFFIAILFTSLKYTIIGCWEPAYLIHNEKVFPSFKMGVTVIWRKFFKILSSYLILTLLIFILNIFAFTFTAGVGLLITMPLSTLMFVILEEVVYRELLGMRYYVDSDHIITPKKLEQQDSFAKVKDII